MSLIALLCLAGWVSPQKPAWNQPSRTTLSILLEQPDGRPLDGGYETRVGGRVEARDDLGWPLEQPVYFRDAGDPDLPWFTATVPTGSEVEVVVFHPDHGLREEILLVGSKPRELRLRMGALRPQGQGRVELVGQPEPAPRMDIGDLWILGPRTGIAVTSTRQFRPPYDLALPAGNYVVQWRGTLNGGCGNTPPFPESGVPVERRLRVLPGENPFFLSHCSWSRIELRVSQAGGRRAVHDPSRYLDDSYYFEAPEAFPRPGYARAKLVQHDREVYLEWGWKGLFYPEPRKEFPLDHPAEQMIPVEPGDYQLVIAGLGIQELSMPITLEPGLQTLAVEVQPR